MRAGSSLFSPFRQRVVAAHLLCTQEAENQMVTINVDSLFFVYAAFLVSCLAVQAGRTSWFTHFSEALFGPMSIGDVLRGITIIATGSALLVGSSYNIFGALLLLVAVFLWGTLLIIQCDFRQKFPSIFPALISRQELLILIGGGLLCALLHAFGWLPELNQWFWYAFVCAAVEYAVVFIAASMLKNSEPESYGLNNVVVAIAWGFGFFGVFHRVLAQSVSVALFAGMFVAVVRAADTHRQYAARRSQWERLWFRVLASFIMVASMLLVGLVRDHAVVLWAVNALELAILVFACSKVYRNGRDYGPLLQRYRSRTSRLFH